MTTKKNDQERADDARLAALAERAERGELPVPKGAPVLRGAAATRQAERDLMEFTGADDPDEAARVLAGMPREGAPRAGEGRGPSPMFRGRISHKLRAALQEIQEAENWTDSEVQRRALADYVVRYQTDHALARPGKPRGTFAKQAAAHQAELMADPDGTDAPGVESRR